MRDADLMEDKESSFAWYAKVPSVVLRQEPAFRGRLNTSFGLLDSVAWVFSARQCVSAVAVVGWSFSMERVGLIFSELELPSTAVFKDADEAVLFSVDVWLYWSAGLSENMVVVVALPLGGVSRQ